MSQVRLASLRSTALLALGLAATGCSGNSGDGTSASGGGNAATGATASTTASTLGSDTTASGGASATGTVVQNGGTAATTDLDATATGGTTAAGGATSTATPNLFALSANLVEVWVNGTRVGSTTTAGALLSAAGAFVAGQENIIAIRASKGTASTPYLQAELDGDFGRAGTSTLWKVKAASTTDETSGSNWAATAYNDSSWSTATNVGVAPTNAALTSGPAKGIWSSSTSDSTVLFRMRLYIPSNWSASSPVGFGSAVTGGEGGDTVTVTTPTELSAAVTASGAKIIQVSGTIDYRGTTSTMSACYQAQCTDGSYEMLGNGQSACTTTLYNWPYDTAGTAPLQVASNKTIIGIGPNATIIGKGFVLKNSVSNVIIRNLTITNINPDLIWGGDAITISGASNVWIDHNRISLIGRQFIVTGWDPAANVTISYNDFDGNTPYSAYCDGYHYWDMLFLGSNDTMTIMDNWIHHMEGRSPHVGGYSTVNSKIHMVNDYHQVITVHACDPGLGGYALYEGSYFTGVPTPFTTNANGSAYAPLSSTLSSTTSACTSALGRACEANYADAGTSSFRLNSDALTAFSSLSSSMVTPYPAAQVPNCVPHLAGPGHI